jgi:FMN phosphatase YigB (HAD superfamily)
MKITSPSIILTLFTCITAAAEPEEVPFNPANTVIAFDLHGVLVRPSLRGMSRAFAQIPVKELLVVLPDLPFIIRDLITYRLQHEISEMTLDKLAERYPVVKQLEQAIIHMTNQQKLKTGVLELLTHLKSLGYTLVLASNIGEKILGDLKKEANPSVSKALSLFDVFITPTHENGYQYKPQAAYFKELLERCSHKNIIFFDDKRINRETAISFGIYAFDTNNIVTTLQGLHILTANSKKE